MYIAFMVHRGKCLQCRNTRGDDGSLESEERRLQATDQAGQGPPHPRGWFVFSGGGGGVSKKSQKGGRGLRVEGNKGVG